MRGIRWLLLLLFAGLVAGASYLTLRGMGLWGGSALAEVKAVPAGHQEIALLAPATSNDAWERLVAAVALLEKEWPSAHPGSPRLRASFDQAFLPLTADVPEIGLRLEGGDAVLWIRWYKLSSEIDGARWIEKLAPRSPPPLAVLGGDSSDRAYKLALALRDRRGQWRGPDPLFLITTATADRAYPGPDANPRSETWPKLLGVYENASFRFSFTNHYMAEALLDFVQEHPEVWPEMAERGAADLAGAVAMGPGWPQAILIAAGQARPTYLATFAWMDDRYSLDLAEGFERQFQKQFRGGGHIVDPYPIPYSVGDFLQPNLYEGVTIKNFLDQRKKSAGHRQLLLLSTGTQRARRVLRSLCRLAPQEVDNLVVLSGDSITFNTVYRDWELLWNPFDMPVPLVFFSHRNPVNRAAGFGQKLPDAGRDTTGTQDLLFYRDIVESVMLASFAEGGVADGGQRAERGLRADAALVRDGLRGLEWFEGRVHSPRQDKKGTPLFDAEGNRRRGTGEHIVWLNPVFADGRVSDQTRVSVWRRATDATPSSVTPSGVAPSWRLVGQPLRVMQGDEERVRD